MAAAAFRSSSRKTVIQTQITFIFLIFVFTCGVESLYFPGSAQSYARFPKWNACINASLSFEFKTTQTEGLLMYTDDGGSYDFFEILHRGGRVRVVLNIVDGRDDHVYLDMGRNVNDGRWHKVEIRRHRMETHLIVDGTSMSEFSFGSDFNFGNVSTNSAVYFGGLPPYYKQNLHALALPSTSFEPHFKGSVRNILYGNCTCQTKRAILEEAGPGVNLYPEELCLEQNPCGEGCICISEDTEPACDCSELQCLTGAVTHYELPMDVLIDTTLINPSGLDATAFGRPFVFRGISGRAIRLEGKDQYVRVTGPGHRYECFGDLDHCPNGYTLGVWVNFEKPAEGEAVYLSNGGHTQTSHGVAMLYDEGVVEFRFRRKNGQEWRVKSDDVLPGTWHHMAVTWTQENGLSMYMDGNFIDRDISPRVRSPGSIDLEDGPNEFMIGRPNDRLNSRDATISVDELNFWSESKSEKEIKELGPFYLYEMGMELLRGNEFPDSNLPAKTQGNPRLVDGKLGKGLRLDGSREFVDGGEQGDTCLGDLSVCQYGVTTSMWIQFNDLADNTYFLSTGNKGFKMYYKDDQLHAEFQQGNKKWKTSWEKPDLDQWYYIELSWNPSDGVKVYQDLKKIAADTAAEYNVPEEGDSKLYIGRDNGRMSGKRYATAIIDEVEFWYADRDKLVDLNFIQRGKPNILVFDMNSKNGNYLFHPAISIKLTGSPRLVPGRLKAALELNGTRQYADLGDQGDNCLGNLDRCHNGLLMSTWIKPGQLRDGMQILSTGDNGIKVWYEDGQLMTTFKTSTRVWTTRSPMPAVKRWYFLELGWDPKRGAKVMLDNKVVGSSNNPTRRSSNDIDNENFYIGSTEDANGRTITADMTFDEIEYWFGSREFLLAHNFLQRGKPRSVVLNMDIIRGNQLVNPYPGLGVDVYGNAVSVPGKIVNAVELDGRSQYVDVGQHLEECLGNPTRCRHGFYGALWANFTRFDENSYLISTGTNGLNMYYKNGRLYVSFQVGAERWEVGLPDMDINKWYFIEYSWHPEKGLEVYVDNKLVGSSRAREVVPVGIRDDDHVYIGRPNDGVEDGNFRYPRVLIDEVEHWYSNREYLIAFDYIQRDKIPHVYFPMEHRFGNTVYHPTVRIVLHNDANLRPAKVGQGVNMDGSGMYVTLDDQENSCMGNLEKCAHGLTMRFWVYPEELINNGYIISSGPYSVFYRDGKLFTTFRTEDREWTTSTTDFERKKWQLIDISWHEDNGLDLYIDQEKKGSDRTPTENTNPINDYNIYIGRPNDDTNGRYSNVKVDELQYWYAPYDVLVALGYLPFDTKGEIYPMDSITGDILDNDNRIVYVIGGPRVVPGEIDNSVSLNGRDQYIDLGQNVTCGGSLENCENGFTLRFKIKPNQLRENMYLISSAPIDVFYKNGRLRADVRTPHQRWMTSSSELDEDAWHQVDISWDKVNGVTMFIDSKKVDESLRPTNNDEDYDTTFRFYIGRANTDMRNERFGYISIDDLQLWRVNRDILIALGIIDKDGNLIEQGQPTTARPTETTDGSVTRPPHYLGNKWIMVDGDDWINYELPEKPGGVPGYIDNEQIILEFRTEDPNALIFYAGDDDKNLHIGLKDGELVLVSDHRDGRRVDRFRITHPKGPLNDNKWHRVIVTKERRRVNIDIDGASTDQTLREEGRLIPNGFVHIGGIRDVSEMTDEYFRRNFVGIIRQAILKGDNIADIDLVELVNRIPRPYWVTIGGNPEFIIPEEADTPEPIQFTSGRAYMRLTKWDARREGNIAFKFRTTEPNGLILYNGGQFGRPDFVAVEMFDGILYFVINIGNGVQRFAFSELKLNDGIPHRVEIKRDGRKITLSIDGNEQDYYLFGYDTNLDLGTFLYIGGVDRPEQLPWHLWTRNPKFFKGCIWDLSINGGAFVDLPAFLQQQVIPGIQVGCDPQTIQCNSNPCRRGICTDIWDAFYCDCAATDYTGQRCQLEAPIVSFDGNDFVRIGITPTKITHTNDISLRFKTPRQSGVLFRTSNDRNSDFMEVFLEDGRLKFRSIIGGQIKEAYFGNDLVNDDNWHTLFIKRRANNLELWIDDREHIISELPDQGYTVDISKIFVGSRNEDIDKENMFVGHMQNLFVDNFRYFEYLKEFLPPGGQLPGGIIVDNSGGSIGEKPIPVNIFSYINRLDSYVALNTLRIPTGGDIDLTFMLKTKDGDGLLFYNAGQDEDFIAMELVDGFINFSFDDGTGSRLVRPSAKGRLDDNEWHKVTLKKGNDDTFEIDIDGTTSRVQRPANTLDLIGNLYVGGVPQYMYDSLPTLVNSKHGYRGCMASIRINRVLYNMQEDGLQGIDNIVEGCTETLPSVYCLSPTGLNVCQNYGVCMEGSTTFICDCNMTSYVGNVCTEEAEGYRFGDNWGDSVVIYEFDEPVNTRVDELAFGFMTWFKNGTLVRVDSGISADFIDVKLENGHIVVVYDLGDGERRVVENRQNFNDGQYHVVRFIREGANTNLTVDNYPSRVLIDREQSIRLFNEQKVIKIAGNKDVRGNLFDVFRGIIAGVYFNGIRVLDLTQKSDSHTTIEGDYIIAPHPFYLPRPKVTVPTPKPTGPDIGGGTVKPGGGDSTGGGGGGVVTSPVVTPTPRPVKPVPSAVPPGHNGGGVGWTPIAGGEGVGVIIDNGPGGAGVNVGGGGAGGGGGAVAGPVVGAAVAGGGGGVGAEGGRAVAVAGAFIGALLLTSSLVWALYKFKPGIIPFGGLGSAKAGGAGAAAGGGGSASGTMTISGPTSNIQMTQFSNNMNGNGSMNRPVLHETTPFINPDYSTPLATPSSVPVHDRSLYSTPNRNNSDHRAPLLPQKTKRTHGPPVNGDIRPQHSGPVDESIDPHSDSPLNQPLLQDQRPVEEEMTLRNVPKVETENEVERALNTLGRNKGNKSDNLYPSSAPSSQNPNYSAISHDRPKRKPKRESMPYDEVADCMSPSRNEDLETTPKQYYPTNAKERQRPQNTYDRYAPDNMERQHTMPNESSPTDNTDMGWSPQGYSHSAPRTTTNYQLVKAAAGAGYGVNGSATTGTGVPPEEIPLLQTSAYSGPSMAAAGTQTSVETSSNSFANYFSQMSASSAHQSSSHAAYGGGSTVAVATGSGTMHRGIQTDPPPPPPAAMESNTMSASSAMYQQNVTGGGSNSMMRANGNANYVGAGNAVGMGGGGGGGLNMMETTASSSFSSYKKTETSFMSGNESYNYNAGNSMTLDGTAGGAGTMASYHMQNMNLGAGPGMQTAFRNSFHGGAVPGLMAAEEIRVDCVIMSSDGRYVVTGSIHGPPQVWDMQTGELIRVMGGEEFSSTDLHLACNDSLLVGQVAEMTQVDPSDVNATNRLHHRKLQIWDFATGNALEMDKNEICTSSCMMNNEGKVVLGRTDKFGGGTTIIVWDLLGNEPLRKLHYDGAVGFADHISYINISTDNRYVIAGFQNSYDGNANFFIFDLTVDNYNQMEPTIIALDACAECTAILDNHEVVTGTRKGELTIWSMRTGKPLRQLTTPTGGYSTLNRTGMTSTSAHNREVKALDISKDKRFLVSASADGTLKVWNMDTEKQMYVLEGHTDEVWCCTLSDDDEIIVSGSRDGSIRLWRMNNGTQVCAYSCGVDIFMVKMSHNKRTIVALGDKFGSRKLIMLQLVRTKTKSRAGSRCTSPYSPGTLSTSSRPMSPNSRPMSPF